MEVARNQIRISVSHHKYVIDLLQETGMLGCKPVDTPMDPNVKLEVNGSGSPIDKGRYQRLVGKLIYLSHTRPNIAFSISCVRAFTIKGTHGSCLQNFKVFEERFGKGIVLQEK